MSEPHLELILNIYGAVKKETNLHLCASLGLLTKVQLKKLKEAGIKHYHCNLETAPSFFPQLCTTHTIDEKIKTINAAKEVGLEICSGGIIGMGETMEQRIELAFELRKINAKSIPLNILNPIQGTPLENMPPLSDEEILTTIALFRLINPDALIRFAGGRNLISHIEDKALNAGINAALVGDLLTTVGKNIEEDIRNFERLGFDTKRTDILENDKIATLLKYDRKHIWHPYTSTIDPLPVYPVESASGVNIELSDGRKLIDGMSSWWAAIHGYNHPVLNQAVINQMNKMAHVMFGGLTHEPAVELARKLLEIVPQKLDKIFFCDSGSVSVEVAMKMALQYWHSKGFNTKKHFATIRSGYHGDTWNAMSVCDPETGTHHIFHGNLPLQYFVPQLFEV